MTGVREEMEACVDRVLRSETFRHAPSSRRLLKYLADRAASGDADQIKEYAIGIDAFGKPADYDPRKDSTVRIQIGRLRQKLTEYYATEGREESLIVDLPKGRLRLECRPRTAEPVAIKPEAELPWRMIATGLAGALLLAVGWGAYATIRMRALGSGAANWTQPLAELWQPFAGNSKPLIIAVGNPLFVQFENKAVFRDLSTEKWDDWLKSPNLLPLTKAMGSQETRPIYYYAAIGEVNSAFLLGQRLGPHQANINVVRSSQLQWQQMADANVLLLGPPRFFGEKLGNLPVSLEIAETADGFRVANPKPGEAQLYAYRDPPGFFAEDGSACILVTHTPGPAANTDIESFAGNSTFGRAGAVNAFTDAAFAQMLVQRMRGASGRMPRYFQVLLRVRYKSGVPTETTYLLHRELRRRD